ncbi:MAG TPA: hypothetical protein VFR18_06795, partial [Terriglobia bacterium]|nr:hypothetical protein [Terriglobia bacterium]
DSSRIGGSRSAPARDETLIRGLSAHARDGTDQTLREGRKLPQETPLVRRGMTLTADADLQGIADEPRTRLQP